MRTLRTLLILACAALPLMAVASVIAVPGPHRVLVPTAFGVTEVGPGIFTDAPDRAAELNALLQDADARAASLFGTSHPRWRTVLCTTEACGDAFGLTGRAIALGDLAILVAPSGLREATLFHEQIHIELASRMDILDAIWPRYPSWFNEGVATYLSGTPRVTGPANAKDAAWITSARTPFGWRRAKQGRTPAEYYGAARRSVAEIDAILGRDGLINLIDDVAAGADFTGELNRRLSQ